jgi:hypothetical protein
MGPLWAEDSRAVQVQECNRAIVPTANLEVTGLAKKCLGLLLGLAVRLATPIRRTCGARGAAVVGVFQNCGPRSAALRSPQRGNERVRKFRRKRRHRCIF